MQQQQDQPKASPKKYGEGAITADNPEALAEEIRKLGAAGRARIAAQVKEADSKRAITSDDPEALAAAIARISALSRERRKQGNNK